MSKTFNLYCDESCYLDNDGNKFMFIGGISCAYPQIKIHTSSIAEIKKRHNFYAEIKWNKVSESKVKFYLDIIDYFFSTDLQFRAISIEKEKSASGAICCFDEHYYDMYYYLLNNNINTRYSYNVYLDIKDTLSVFKVHRLYEILNAKYGVFRNIQNIRSHESLLLQLADFILGAVAYNANNQKKTNEAKTLIIDRIKKHCNIDLDENSYNRKLNLYFIELH